MLISIVLESLGAVQILGALKGAAVGVGAAMPALVSNSAAATQQLVTAATPVVTQGAILAGKGLTAAGHVAGQGAVALGELAVKGAAAAQHSLSNLVHTVGAATAGGVATAGAAKGTLGTVRSGHLNEAEQLWRSRHTWPMFKPRSSHVGLLS